MLKIRLTRGGAKKRPYYSIVVADSHSPRDGRFIERVGTYNPLLKKDDPNRVNLKLEALEGWLKKGAQPTDRVARFLAAEGLVKWQHGNNPNKGKPGKKAEERVTERAERAAALAAAPPPAPEEVVEAVAEEPVEAVAEEPVEAAAETPVEAAAAPEAEVEPATPAEEPAVVEATAEEAAPTEEPPAEEAQAEEATPVPAEPEPAAEEAPTAEAAEGEPEA